MRSPRLASLALLVCALELGVLGLADDTHAAPTELGEDIVMADRAADHDSQIAALPDTW